MERETDHCVGSGTEGFVSKMTPIIIIAIGLLGTIFMASFVALLIVCRHKHSGRVDFTAHRNEEKYEFPSR